MAFVKLTERATRTAIRPEHDRAEIGHEGEQPCQCSQRERHGHAYQPQPDRREHPDRYHVRELAEQPESQDVGKLLHDLVDTGPIPDRNQAHDALHIDLRRGRKVERGHDQDHRVGQRAERQAEHHLGRPGKPLSDALRLDGRALGQRARHGHVLEPLAQGAILLHQAVHEVAALVREVWPDPVAEPGEDEEHGDGDQRQREPDAHPGMLGHPVRRAAQYGGKQDGEEDEQDDIGQRPDQHDRSSHRSRSGLA